MYNEQIQQKAAETMAKYYDEVMRYYLFNTGTGILIVITTIILVLGAIIISSQLGTIIKNQKSLIDKKTITNNLLVKISNTEK
ncbi:MAG: hypothetical protein UD936_04105 [Acutalibacteraceae bacterium]|nr:hypothetical protein [Acutalibacteraceae bacterium]